MLLISVAAGATLLLEPRSRGLFALTLVALTASGVIFVSRAPGIAVAMHDAGIRLLRRLRDAIPMLRQRLRTPAPIPAQVAGVPIGQNRWPAALWTLLAWAFASAAFWALFAMIGVSVEMAEAVLILVAVNVAGAASFFTIAGLGISEAGLAGVLVLLGFPTIEAVSLGLIIRPTALMMTLASCAACELDCRHYGRVKNVVTGPLSSR